MKNQLFAAFAAMFAACFMIFSCAKDVKESSFAGTQDQATRAYGDKSPKVLVYVETNDVSPLNGLCYEMGGEKFIDALVLFASNIHKDASDFPTIYLNDKLTRVLEPDPVAPTTTGYHKYVAPLQTAGTKVFLGVLGDWQGIGVANLSIDKADRFADILVYAVDRYGLDGVTFDDEYSNYPGSGSSSPSQNPNSYSYVIKALHAKLDTKFGVGVKKITVFEWGYVTQIDATAGAMIDLADQGVFGANSFRSSSYISGVTNDRWCPQAIQLGQSYSGPLLSQITNNSNSAKTGNYGGIMMFNLRRSNDVNPLPVFQAIANGAYNSATVSNVCATPYAQDWDFIPTGYTITKDDVPAYLPKFVGN